MKVIKTLVEVKTFEDHLDIITNTAIIRIYACSDDIFRIRCTFEQDFPSEASYALVMTAWDDYMDDVITDRNRITALSIALEDQGEYYSWASKSVVLKIYKAPFAIVIEDLQGNVLHQDILNRGYVKDDLERITHYSALSDDDYYYGFGEKSGTLNKKIVDYACTT